ncbi:MAG TPA: hypothetical protein VJQ55_01225 [Candidatus Binatia bacterium]|nr:hypothetical protein [Candidatus Binatia bacterium]
MPKIFDRCLLYLYAGALFLSAALLFLVQPMIAKMILPFLGGSPAVWNTCLFFFQTFLLLGYLYAHFGSSWLGVKPHMLLHLVMIGAALYFLPVALPSLWLDQPDADPIRSVLWVLLVSVGFPFFVLSATAPLLQKWFSSTGHADARDPYFLYAASNAGSLLGLLAYPLVIEPRLSLMEQARLWLYIYIGFLAVAIICGMALRAVRTRHQQPLAAGDLADPAMDLTAQTAPTVGRRLRWIVLSFAPSSLLLGVTTYVTTDLASVPLLWVLPLSFYLVSFIIAYQRDSCGSSPFLVKRQGFLLLAAAITYFAKATDPAVILLPLHLLAFFVTCLVCHTELAKDRPATRYLTEYYLWISFGGLLGGFFNAFLAPVIFSTVLEYPLAMVAAALVRPRLAPHSEQPRDNVGDVLWPAALFLVVFALVSWTRGSQLLSSHFEHVLIFGISALIALSFARRPVRFALGLGAIMLATINYHGVFGNVIFTERSFFGVYRAIRDQGNKFHYIFHGTTLHGAQSLDPSRRLRPLSYYHPTGPAGQIFDRLAMNGFNKPVAIVGLGAGALACYARPDQNFVFYEIDRLVERIARNSNLFTYLKECAPHAKVHIGDARVTVAGAQHGFYGMFILDAFSGDSIPVHLLTKEAVALYLAKLAPDGLLLFHLSNRYMDLTKVVGRVAAALKVDALIQEDSTVSNEEIAEGKQPSTWLIMARQKGPLGAIQSDPRWRPLANDHREPWTDNYSNILQALRLW